MPSEWFEQKDFSSAGEFLDALSPRASTWDVWQKGPFVFRGHADDSWVLLPSALRPDGWAEIDPHDPADALEHERCLSEQSVLSDFATSLDQHGWDVPGGHSLLKVLEGNLAALLILRPELAGTNYLLSRVHLPNESLTELAALAQHHRLPTRLLDFTRRGFVAAYFAALPPPTEPTSPLMAVWAIQQSFFPGGYSVLLKTNGTQYGLVTASHAANPNLHAQSGLFVTWWDPNGQIIKLDDLVQRVMTGEIPRIKQVPPDPPVMLKLTLPRTEARELLRLLALEGITGASMFPGTDGVVRELKERRLRNG